MGHGCKPGGRLQGGQDSLPPGLCKGDRGAPACARRRMTDTGRHGLASNAHCRSLKQRPPPPDFRRAEECGASWHSMRHRSDAASVPLRNSVCRLVGAEPLPMPAMPLDSPRGRSRPVLSLPVAFAPLRHPAGGPPGRKGRRLACCPSRISTQRRWRSAQFSTSAEPQAVGRGMAQTRSSLAITGGMSLALCPCAQTAT